MCGIRRGGEGSCGGEGSALRRRYGGHDDLVGDRGRADGWPGRVREHFSPTMQYGHEKKIHIL
jgi:hypothetical protein